VIAFASVREDIAGFLGALLTVYTLVIIAYVIVNLVLSFGARPPYSKTVDAVLGFLRDTAEPYIRIFRRFIPMVGPLDLSPLVALIVLQLVGSIVVNLVRG
jgi:YggT family protein